MIMTQGRFEEYVALSTAIDERAGEILAQVRALYVEVMGAVEAARLVHDCLHYVEVVEESYYSPGIWMLVYAGEERWAFGGHEHHGLSLPASYLYTRGWEELERARILALKDRMDRERQADVNAVERRERAKLGELLAKYGQVEDR